MHHTEHNERENGAQREHVLRLNRTIERWRTCAIFSILALCILVGIETYKIFKLRHEIAANTITPERATSNNEQVDKLNLDLAYLNGRLEVAEMFQDTCIKALYNPFPWSELKRLREQRAYLEPYIKSGRLAIVGAK